MFACSEFSDIFDLAHFKRVLDHDVRILSSLPSTHIMTRPAEENRTPLHVSPQWIRAHYLKRVWILFRYVISASNKICFFLQTFLLKFVCVIRRRFRRRVGFDWKSCPTNSLLLLLSMNYIAVLLWYLEKLLIDYHLYTCP